MSLGVQGIVRIYDEPTENKLDDGVFFNCVGEGKDPKIKGGRKYYSVSVFVPNEKVEVAREDLRKGSSIYIRHGDLDGKRNELYPTRPYMQVRTSWFNIEPLVMTMRAETQ